MATCMLTPALIALGIVRLAKQANIDIGLRWHLRPAIITLMMMIEFLFITWVLVRIELAILKRTNLLRMLKEKLSEDQKGKP